MKYPTGSAHRGCRQSLFPPADRFPNPVVRVRLLFCPPRVVPVPVDRLGNLTIIRRRSRRGGLDHAKEDADSDFIHGARIPRQRPRPWRLERVYPLLETSRVALLLLEPHLPAIRRFQLEPPLIPLEQSRSRGVAAPLTKRQGKRRRPSRRFQQKTTFSRCASWRERDRQAPQGRPQEPSPASPVRRSWSPP